MPQRSAWPGSLVQEDDMAGDRWRQHDRYRGGDERYRFESNRRYETEYDRDGTRRHEADETFGAGNHDYPAGTFGRSRRSYEDDRQGNRYGASPYDNEGGGAPRPSRYAEPDRRSATEMAFGRAAPGARDYRPGDFGRNYEDRGILERAGDEVASWFGGENADRPPRRDGDYGDHRGRGPKSYQRSDDRIREDVNDRLTDDPRLDASEIEVVVGSREVTLSGMVRTRQDKRRAEDIVDSVSGVTHVQNNLRVHNAGGSWSSHQQGGGTSAAHPTGAARSTTAEPLDRGEPDEGGIGAKIP
jgi:osmotically-inducible protein OsmY